MKTQHTSLTLRSIIAIFAIAATSMIASATTPTAATKANPATQPAATTINAADLTKSITLTEIPETQIDIESTQAKSPETIQPTLTVEPSQTTSAAEPVKIAKTSSTDITIQQKK